jgi:hypothetical protein
MGKEFVYNDKFDFPDNKLKRYARGGEKSGRGAGETIFEINRRPMVFDKGRR